MMDELGARSEGDNYFFGVPFRFLEVKEDDFYSMRRPHRLIDLVRSMHTDAY